MQTPRRNDGWRKKPLMPRLGAVSVRSTVQDETKCQHIRVMSSHVCAATANRQLKTDGDAEQSPP